MKERSTQADSFMHEEMFIPHFYEVIVSLCFSRDLLNKVNTRLDFRTREAKAIK